VVHITAVVVAFGAVFADPVFLAVVAKAPIGQRAMFHHAQITFSKRVTGPSIGVILLAGIYLATDRDLWSETWVTVPFVPPVHHRRARRYAAPPRRGAPRGERGGG
jgi:hypothetical protein